MHACMMHMHGWLRKWAGTTLFPAADAYPPNMHACHGDAYWEAPHCWNNGRATITITITHVRIAINQSDLGLGHATKLVMMPRWSSSLADPLELPTPRTRSCRFLEASCQERLVPSSWSLVLAASQSAFWRHVAVALPTSDACMYFCALGTVRSGAVVNVSSKRR